ncbi:FG-GAP repeat domain-containing protein [Paenibacillus donghaensis]|uniref:VCBS repeat-containing protein n=1 Tax=Paenibacillus donghaensis TaxID=414771 RepID=A0A2Z2KER1_9BACL|nr:VCBS repeat-containing protein [Paenibacillus donghaensis]ASA24227.1 hypothetical protein B9T62_27765 [Paenibacillus donghaensis]
MRLYKPWTTLVLLTLFISGCSAVKTPGDLLRAPEQNKTNGTITGIVNPFLPAQSHLTVPVQSEAGSAIQLQDLDQDGQDEIIAFYKTDKTDYEINALILSQSSGTWKKLTTVTGIGRELDLVQFSDVTGDGAADVLLGFGGGEGLSKELAVYTLKEGNLTELLKQPYDYMIAGDLTGTGRKQVALFQSVATTDVQPESKLSLYQFDKGQPQVLSEERINGTILKVNYGQASPTGNGLFVEAAVGAHSSYTALLTWDNDHFTDILAADVYTYKDELAASQEIVLQPSFKTDGVLGANTMAGKDYPLYSRDVNSDGIIEVGFLVPPVGLEAEAPLATPFISKYYQWDGRSRLRPVEERFDRWGYNFHIPQSWTGHYSLELAKGSNEPWTMVKFNDFNEDTGKPVPLLTLRMVSKQAWAQTEASLLAEKAEYTLLYELPNPADSATPSVLVAILPSAAEDGGLQGTALQAYRERLLTLDEVRQLAGSLPETDTAY